MVPDIGRRLRSSNTLTCACVVPLAKIRLGDTFAVAGPRIVSIVVFGE